MKLKIKFQSISFTFKVTRLQTQVYELIASSIDWNRKWDRWTDEKSMLKKDATPEEKKIGEENGLTTLTTNVKLDSKRKVFQ